MKQIEDMGAMRYKPLDKVRIKSIDWYYDNRDRIDEVACGNTNFIPDMVKYCGGIVTISAVLPTLEVYHIKEDGGMYNWTDEMIEGLVEEEMIDLTSIVMETVEEKTIQNALTYGYNLPEGYQFVDENGNVINAQKIILEKKKKEYPKTYEECCEILEDVADCSLSCFACGVLNNLQKLLLCRDAYWKIAGDEMGLGKPWEPDWSDYENIKYIIGGYDGEIGYDQNHHIHKILAFPTPEMRDAFYENFKSEIESCKELL